MRMAKTLLTLLVALSVVVATVLSADQGTRMSDKEVKKLIGTIDKNVEHFTKTMDSLYRKARIRSADGEVDFEDYLKNLKDLAKKMKSRFDLKNPANGGVLA